MSLVILSFNQLPVEKATTILCRILIYYYYTTSYATPSYYTEAPKYYTTKAPEYFTTTYAAPSYYTEAPKYYSAPSYYTEAAPKYYIRGQLEAIVSVSVSELFTLQPRLNREGDTFLLTEIEMWSPAVFLRSIGFYEKKKNIFAVRTATSFTPQSNKAEDSGVISSIETKIAFVQYKSIY
ncbi:hypothetical protein OUZ56_017100 [Daphnia magna]|uniref:Uncharacterized protein n=1 Tax=Daphnia magna TaxID=35525 RepID=A0ABR0AS61_9CRUS|nr:hypothetical protein OUZ56_017100 [Daphnia magna]